MNYIPLSTKKRKLLHSQHMSLEVGEILNEINGNDNPLVKSWERILEGFTKQEKGKNVVESTEDKEKKVESKEDKEKK